MLKIVKAQDIKTGDTINVNGVAEVKEVAVGERIVGLMVTYPTALLDKVNHAVPCKLNIDDEVMVLSRPDVETSDPVDEVNDSY